MIQCGQGWEDIQGTENAPELTRLYCYKENPEEAQIFAEQTKKCTKEQAGLWFRQPPKVN